MARLYIFLFPPPATFHLLWQMDHPDVSVVAVELSGNRPGKTMVLRGEGLGSPKFHTMQPRMMKPARMDGQWENTLHGVHPAPPRRISSREPHWNDARREDARPPQDIPSSPSLPSGSEYSSDSKHGQRRSSQNSGTSNTDEKSKTESDEEHRECSPPPIVQVEAVPPLTKVHFSCYQSHRSFMVSKNAYYSVPCMTCLKADQQPRYRCTFCCLRVCGDCAKGISNCKDRSLMEFLENLVQGLEGS
nr:hypothetical protein CPAG_03220 [Coccidioides posadasii RMSCC 3488]